MLIKVAALECNGIGIRVNAVSPGYVDSPMMQKNFEKFPLLEESIRKNVPLNRMCTPEEIGNVVAFLGSDYASYISGQEIGVDGGHMWEILEDPTGMAYRTIHEKAKGHISRELHAHLMEQLKQATVEIEEGNDKV